MCILKCGIKSIFKLKIINCILFGFSLQGHKTRSKRQRINSKIKKRKIVNGGLKLREADENDTSG